MSAFAVLKAIPDRSVTYLHPAPGVSAFTHKRRIAFDQKHVDTGGGENIVRGKSSENNQIYVVNINFKL